MKCPVIAVLGCGKASFDGSFSQRSLCERFDNCVTDNSFPRDLQFNQFIAFTANSTAFLVVTVITVYYCNYHHCSFATGAVGIAYSIYDHPCIFEILVLTLQIY